jgi:hypothetical protein
VSGIFCFACERKAWQFKNAIERGQAVDPSLNEEGFGFSNDALDLHWSVQMSEVLVTGDPSYAQLRKLRSNRVCIGRNASLPIRIYNESTLSTIRQMHQQFPSGLAVMRGSVVSCLLRSRLAQPNKGGIAPTLHQQAKVAVSHPAADIFVVSSKASAGARSPSYLVAPQASTDRRTGDLKLHCLNRRERGLEVCR